MEKAKKSPVYRWMRSLHRDIGFFLIGLTCIYCISGSLLIYRETGFLKKETRTEKTIDPGLNANQLERALRLKGIKIIGEDDATITFTKGTYNRATGLASYTNPELPPILTTFNGLHKAANDQPRHWFSLVFACCLLFLAISSFWMYRPDTRIFKRGVLLAVSGVVLSIVLLLM